MIGKKNGRNIERTSYVDLNRIRNAYGLLYITEYRSRFICNLS